MEMDGKKFILEGEKDIMSVTTASSLLKELKENICDDVLNFDDHSVGIYSYSDLREWVKNDEEHLNGVTILSHEKDTAVLECEGFKFEIFDNGNAEEGIVWDIRHYFPENESI